MNEKDIRSLTPHFPIYSQACHFLRILEGMFYSLFRSMFNEIWEQRGNPQETVSWTEPESWIPERLQGEEQALALRIWRESKQELNPRHLRGVWYLTTKHELLTQDNDGILHNTSRGHQFLHEPASLISAEIDSYEGVLISGNRSPHRRTILNLLAGDLFPSSGP